MSIGIKITQTILDQNNHNWLQGKSVGSIVTRNDYPNKFWVTKRIGCSYQHKTNLHAPDGWKPYDKPIAGTEYDSSTHKIGQLIEEPERFTNEIIALTNEEIQSNITAQAQSEQQVLIQQKLEGAVIEEAQAIEDDNEALDNQALYPMWEYPFDYTVDFKCQHFTDENELVLYKCIQAHTSQADWQPKDVPALFTKIEFSNGIEVWSQPTGGDGKYPYLDLLTGEPYLVTHNGQTWQNDHQGGLNVWEPGVFGWIIYNG